jgi:hypothetical protein
MKEHVWLENKNSSNTQCNFFLLIILKNVIKLTASK